MQKIVTVISLVFLAACSATGVSQNRVLSQESMEKWSYFDQYKVFKSEPTDQLCARFLTLEADSALAEPVENVLSERGVQMCEIGEVKRSIDVAVPLTPQEDSVRVALPVVDMVVKARSLNMRDVPAGRVIKTLPKGQVVSLSAVQGRWFEILSDEKTGWVRSEYLTYRAPNMAPLNSPYIYVQPPTETIQEVFSYAGGCQLYEDKAKQAAWISKGRTSLIAKAPGVVDDDITSAFFSCGQKPLPVVCGDLSPAEERGERLKFITMGTEETTWISRDEKDFEVMWMRLCQNPA